MTDTPGTLRPLHDPRAEMERLAEARKHGPAKVLHVGDVIRVYDSGGEVFTGTVMTVDRHPSRAFAVACVPLEEDGHGSQA